MGNVLTKIQFSRCLITQPSRREALIHLNEREFSPGEPVLVNYYEEYNSSINTMMVVGLRSGKGPDCYRVITLGQYEIVWGVGVLPDTSDMVHGQLYLWKNSDGVWCYVSDDEDGVRHIEPILPYPHTFINVADNTIYVSDADGRVRSINDVYTKSEIDSLLNSISGGDFSSISDLEQRLQQAYDRIYEVARRNDELVEVIEGMQNSLSIVEEFGEKVEDIEAKVSSLEVDPESGSVSGTFSSIQIEDPENNNIVIDKTTVVTSENIINYLGDAASAIPEEVLNQTLI